MQKENEEILKYKFRPEEIVEVNGNVILKTQKQKKINVIDWMVNL